MNNLTPFNLSGFNLSSKSQEEDIEFSMFCYEKYDVTITFSKNTLLNITCSEKIITKNQLTMAIPEDLNLEGFLQVNAKGDTFVLVEMKVENSVQASAYGSEDITENINGSTGIKLSAYVSCNKEVEFLFEEKLHLPNMYGSLDILDSGFVINELLITNFSSIVLGNLISKFNGTLHSGDKLVIDSDKFTVYVNDKNLLKEYSGDWINLSRDVNSLEISSMNNGKLKGKLLFRERFL